MPRHDRNLRDDALGALLARHFAETRAARPSPAVWKRIERTLEPPRGGGPWGWLGRFGAIMSPDGRPMAQLLAWAALPSAVAVGLLVMAGLAVGDSSAPLAGTRPGRPVHAAGRSAAELAYQPRTEGYWIGAPSGYLLGRQLGPSAVPGFGMDMRLSPLAVALGIAIQ